MSSLNIQHHLYEPLSTTSMRNSIEPPEENNWPGMHEYFDNLIKEHENRNLEQSNSEHLSYKDLKTVLISSIATLLTVLLVIVAVIWSCEQERLDRELLDFLFVD